MQPEPKLLSRIKLAELATPAICVGRQDQFLKERHMTMRDAQASSFITPEGKASQQVHV